VVFSESLDGQSHGSMSKQDEGKTKQRKKLRERKERSRLWHKEARNKKESSTTPTPWDKQSDLSVTWDLTL